jgi:hypothetical protein
MLRVWPRWCAKRTQGRILVRAECLYVQSLLLVLLALKVCSRGYKRTREMRSQVSGEGEVELKCF